MTGTNAPLQGRMVSTVLGVAWVLSTMAAGGLLGGAYVRFLMPRAPDGWTGIARGLGGLMVGGGIGLVLALVLLPMLARRGRRATAVALAASLLVGVIVLLILRAAAGPRRDVGTLRAPTGSVDVGVYRAVGSIPSSLQMMPSITSSAPPPIESRRLSR